MITFIAHLRVRPDKVAAFEALMDDMVRTTRSHEPYVLYYAFARSADEADTFVVVEVYRDAEAHAAHMASAWVRASLPRSALLIDGRPHIRQYVSGDSLPVRRTITSD